MSQFNVNNPVWQGNNVSNISRLNTYKIGYNESIKDDGYRIIDLNPDIKVFIYGTEIFDIMTVGGDNSIEGSPNTCSIKIYNPRRRYVITKQDLMQYWRTDKSITQKIYTIKSVSGIDILQGQSIFQTGDPVRIFMKGRFSQFYYPLFTGFVTDWNVDYPFGGVETLTLSCKDWFWLLEKNFANINPSLYNEARGIARSSAIFNQPSIDSNGVTSETPTATINESSYEDALAGLTVREIFEKFLLSDNQQEFDICNGFSQKIEFIKNTNKSIQDAIDTVMANQLFGVPILNASFTVSSPVQTPLIQQSSNINLLDEKAIENLQSILDSNKKEMQSLAMAKIKALFNLPPTKTSGVGALNYIWSDITKGQSSEIEADKIDSYLNTVTRTFPITYNLVIDNFYVDPSTMLVLKGNHPAISLTDVNKFGLLLDNIYNEILNSSPTNGTETTIDAGELSILLKKNLTQKNLLINPYNAITQTLLYDQFVNNQKNTTSDFLSNQYGIIKDKNGDTFSNGIDFDNLILLAQGVIISPSDIKSINDNINVTIKRNVDSNWKLGTKSPHQIMRESIEGINDQCYSVDNKKNAVIGPRLFVIMPDDFYNGLKSPIASTMRQYSLTSNVFRTKMQILNEIADAFNFRFYATPFGDIMFEPWWVDTMPHDWDINIKDRDHYLRPIFIDLPSQFKDKDEEWSGYRKIIHLGKNILDKDIGGYSQYYLQSYGGNTFSPLIIQEKDEIRSNMTFKGDLVHDSLLLTGNNNNDTPISLDFSEETQKIEALSQGSNLPAAEWIADGFPQYLDQLSFVEIKNKFKKFIDIESLIDEGLYIPSWDLVKTFGYKDSPTVQKRFIIDKNAANLYVRILFLQMLSDIYTTTIDMIYRPECILNRPYYIESQEVIGIMNKYSYSYSVDAEITWSSNFKFIRKQVFNKIYSFVQNKLSGYDLSPSDRTNLKFFEFDTTFKDKLMDLQAFEKIGSMLDIDPSDLARKDEIPKQDVVVPNNSGDNKKATSPIVTKKYLNISRDKIKTKLDVEGLTYGIYEALSGPPFSSLPINILPKNKKSYVTIDISMLITNANFWLSGANNKHNPSGETINLSSHSGISPIGIATTIRDFYKSLNLTPTDMILNPQVGRLDADIYAVNRSSLDTALLENDDFAKYKLNIPINTDDESQFIIGK